MYQKRFGHCLKNFNHTMDHGLISTIDLVIGGKKIIKKNFG
jgi:hypothetical protein